MRRNTRRFALAMSVLSIALVTPMVTAAAGNGSGWTSAGGDRQNTRHQKSEHQIAPDTVGDLEVAWVLDTDGDVSATPAVDGNAVYATDWGGSVWAVDRLTGDVRWKVSVPDISGIPGDKSRTTPAIAGNLVIIGNQGPFGGGGLMMALDKKTGETVWTTQLDEHPAAIITQSATVFAGVVYVGVSSLEEAYAAFIPGYPCCTFRGSMAALDLKTGQVIWQTPTVPEGFTGNAVWGSSPAIDTKRNQVYVATGNNYDAPPEVLQCVEDNEGDPDAQAACLPADNYFDAVLALDMGTGEVNWATFALPFDAWNVDCLPFLGEGNNCPEPAGPDFDFGQAPALYTLRGPGGNRDLVGVGQKSGQYWSLDPDTGEVEWVTQAGPGGVAGGLQWGSAVDGERVYVADANSDDQNWTLPDGSVTTDGVWSALDARTGEILWQAGPSEGGDTSGPVTVANGVMFSCSLDPLGHMYAIDAATGEELWKFASGGSCLSGASISRGMVYWGSGYANFGDIPNNQLYAFELG